MPYHARLQDALQKKQVTESIIKTWKTNGFDPNEFKGNSGWFITEEKRRSGLSQLLLASSLVVLEANGVSKLVIYDDNTRNRNRPSFSSKPENGALITLDKFTSLYARYRPLSYDVRIGDGFPIGAMYTTTRITGPHISMLRTAFGNTSAKH